MEFLNWRDALLPRGKITCATPERKDNVFIVKFEGQRHYKQIKYLLRSLRDTLSIAYGDINAGIEMIADDSFESKFGKQLTFSQPYDFRRLHK